MLVDHKIWMQKLWLKIKLYCYRIRYIYINALMNNEYRKLDKKIIMIWIQMLLVVQGRSRVGIEMDNENLALILRRNILIRMNARITITKDIGGKIIPNWSKERIIRVQQQILHLLETSASKTDTKMRGIWILVTLITLI